jgi:hypothetical protein
VVVAKLDGVTLKELQTKKAKIINAFYSSPAPKYPKKHPGLHFERVLRVLRDNNILHKKQLTKATKSTKSKLQAWE